MQGTTPSGGRRAAVLIVDQEPTARGYVSDVLTREGFATTCTASAEEALVVVETLHPDVIVTDIYLPGMDGITLVEELRTQGSDVGVIMVTDERSEETRVLGLDRGADDCMLKPFSPRELAARVRALQRRRHRDGPEALEFPGLRIDGRARVVETGEGEVALTRKEFDALFLLASHAGRTFSRDELLEQVWHSSPDWQDGGTVTEHIRRLRRKLGAANAERIATIHGVGYRFVP